MRAPGQQADQNIGARQKFLKSVRTGMAFDALDRVRLRGIIELIGTAADRLPCLTIS